ncbi:MAG: DUF2924 domain-containing protein [Proteobacteria bacterium]|nr:DUF2924 domain-containing protein [Pseudomonadota bacterium]
MSNPSKKSSTPSVPTLRRVAVLEATDLPAKLAHLSGLSLDDLKSAWTKIIGGSPPKNTRREYLLRAIAHEFQVGVHGGIGKTLYRALMKVADAKAGGGLEAATQTRSLKAGARIYREWRGAVHEVEVIDGGYRFQGVVFKSLSVIARQITGTRWSGPAFFGLKNNGERGRNAL